MARCFRFASCRLLAVLAVPLVFAIAPRAEAGSGLLGLDHLVPYDDHGIWARRNQLLLMDGMLAAEAGIALWRGGDDRLGHTAWQSIDATLVGGVASEVLKYSFSRARPYQDSSPNQWFQGSGHNSFPSGEATISSAIVMPFMLEYGHDHPAVYALALLPAYDAVARVKVHGHWQSDVLAGLALGAAAGYYAHERKRTPLVLGVLPQGFYIGLRHTFGEH